MNLQPVSIVWFRQDLRLADNPALQAAIARGGAILPVYIASDDEDGEWPAGGAARWWLHESLSSLASSLQDCGSRLIVRTGSALATLRALCHETGADAVYWNRRYEPAALARDTQLKSSLRSDGILVASYNGSLLIEPWEVATQTGRPFQVFTPFWRRVLADLLPSPLPATPDRLPAPNAWPLSMAVAELALLPQRPWYATMAKTWQPGEVGANRRLERFVDAALDTYAQDRDRPAIAGTSQLSPHLHHGEISPRQIWHCILSVADTRDIVPAQLRNGKYIAELGWREFSYHLLFHFPHTHSAPLREPFAQFPWRDDPIGLRAWQRGRTGVPLVDAGMRELWATGWMHNRVRMIVGSFLVKNLRLHWLEGARWFWDTLVDADMASNTQGWQWVSGCGADSAPYFRVFNPVTQSERFDPQGVYLRRWLPELAKLQDQDIHAPWLASEAALTTAGIVLGRDYPRPIVDLKESRDAALDAWRSLKDDAKETRGTQSTATWPFP